MDDLEKLKELLEEDWRQARAVHRECDHRDWIAMRGLLVNDDIKPLLKAMRKRPDIAELVQRFAMLAMDQVAYDCM